MFLLAYEPVLLDNICNFKDISNLTQLSFYSPVTYCKNLPDHLQCWRKYIETVLVRLSLKQDKSIQRQGQLSV